MESNISHKISEALHLCATSDANIMHFGILVLWIFNGLLLFFVFYRLLQTRENILGYSHDCSTIVCLFGEYKKFKFLFNYKLCLQVALNFYTGKVCYPKSIFFMWMRQEYIILFHFFLFSLKRDILGICKFYFIGSKELFICNFEWFC